MRRWILALTCFFPTWLFAEEETPSLTSLMGGDSSYWKEFLHMVMNLSLLLLVVFLTVFLLKRFIGGRAAKGGSMRKMHVLERRPLAQKSSLYLVDLCGKKVVIGESAAGLHLITEIPDELYEEEELSTEPKLSFADVMRQKFRKKSNEESSPEACI